MNEKFAEAIKKLEAFHLPRYRDLPEIELYMDQVISTVEKYLFALKVGEKSLLTPSMVNNYVKNGVIPPPERKRYTRDHLAQIIIICTLKQTIELSDVASILKKGADHFGMEKAYDEFVALYEKYIALLVDDARKADDESGNIDVEYKTIVDDAVLSGASRIVVEYALASLQKDAPEDDAPPKSKRKKQKAEEGEEISILPVI